MGTLWPIAVPPVALVAGVLILWLGLRGRRVDDHPVCRKCGRDLTGVESPRCPECGQPADRPRVGNRERRPILLAAGGTLATVALLVTLIGGAWLLTPERSAGHKPAWLLQFESGLALARPRKVAADELVRRLRVNELDAEQAAEVAALFLEHQSDAALAWEPAKGDFVRMAHQRRHVDEPDWQTFLERGAAAGLSVRRIVWLPPDHAETRPAALGVTSVLFTDAEDLVGSPVVAAEVDPTKFRLDTVSSHPVYLCVERTDGISGQWEGEYGERAIIDGDGVRNIGGGDGNSQDRLVLHEPILHQFDSKVTGPQIVLIPIPVEAVAGPASVTSRARTLNPYDIGGRTVGLARPRAGVDVPRFPLRLVADADESVRAVEAGESPALSTTNVPAEVLRWMTVALRSGVGDRRKSAGVTLRPIFDVDADGPPLAYAVHADAGDGWRRVGSLAWRPGDPHRGVAMTDVQSLALDPLDDPPVTLRLVPDVRVAERQITPRTMRGGTVTFGPAKLAWPAEVAELVDGK